MGKEWDGSGVAFDPEFWRHCYRVLKPGGWLLAFGGSRTSHRMACAIEDAGFELRDTIMWLYGCLSDDTEILVEGQWVPYHKAMVGNRALCYNPDEDSYAWLPIQETFRYDISDTAYRIRSDHTDQIVSRNHRCLVERGGAYVFEFAETLAQEPTVRVPVLEGLPELLRDLPLPDSRASEAEQGLFPGVRLGLDAAPQETPAAFRAGRHGAEGVRDVRRGGLEGSIPRQAYDPDVLLLPVRGEGQSGEPDPVRRQRQGEAAPRKRAGRREQSGVEGRRHLLQDARQLHRRPLRSMPAAMAGDGSPGRLRDGASADGGASLGAASVACRGRASSGPQSGQQRAEQPATVRQQSGPQTVRASRYTRADLGRITPIHYDGVVWCVRVPTGAFVARRNGKVFVTGNSGFPKSHQHLKPAFEPIVVARKPPEGSVAANVERHGCGTLDIDGCRIECGEALVRPPIGRRDNAVLGRGLGVGVQVEPTGRWPANVCHDGSDEVLAAFAAFGEKKAGVAVNRNRSPGTMTSWYGKWASPTGADVGFGDAGSAARFFYSSKASKADRGEGNAHPTVKPTALMEWLVKLVSPNGGLILDPFAGSGTTGVACARLGVAFVGVEQNEAYCEIAARRLDAELDARAGKLFA